MAKRGKINVVKVDPFAYNIGLFAIPGIGKTELAFTMLDKYLGEDGYIIYDIGLEDGTDAIQGVNAEKIPTWQEFVACNNDVIKGKNTDYKNLRVVAIDTIDELARLSEAEVIRLANIENPTKARKKTFNEVGFGNYDRQSALILAEFKRLRDAGIQVFVIGHTKAKTKIDPSTGIEYDTLTAKISERLFNDIKSKMHVLGLGHIDRNVEDKVLGKDIMGKDRIKHITKSERRIITFRDENFAVDSKSRFADIEPVIDFNAEVLYNTIINAIEKAFNKRDIGVTMDEADKVQKETLKENADKFIERVQEEMTVSQMVQAITDKVQSKTLTEDQMRDLKAKLISVGVPKISDLLNIEEDIVYTVYELIK